MQHSLTAIPVNTNLLLTNNCTQCTVSADTASIYTIQLLSWRIKLIRTFYIHITKCLQIICVISDFSKSKQKTYIHLT
jgi:hypothetical protein